MAKFKIKDLIVESDNVKYKNEKLTSFLNNNNCLIRVLYGGSLEEYGEYSGRKYVPFADTFVTTNAQGRLTYSNNLVTIGKGIKTVKISYDIRYDWDTPTGINYHAMIADSSGDLWSTHNSVYKNDNNAIHQGYGSLILNVTEGQQIGLLVWLTGVSGATTIGSANYSMTVEVID